MAKAKISALRIPPESFKFTASSVLKRTNVRKQDYLCRDKSDTKLCIFVRSTGRKVYRAQARMKGGNEIKVTHGVVGELTLKTAKEMHENAMTLLRQGINPNQVITEHDELPNIRDSIEHYLKHNKQLSDSTRILYRGLLRNHLTDKMFHKPFEELNENRFLDWHDSFKEHPSIAINCLKLLSSTFNAQPLKIRRDAENPRTLVKRNKSMYTSKTKSDVYLNPEWIQEEGSNEIEQFLELLMDVHFGFDEPISEDEYSFIPPTQDQVYIDAVLMLLLTGVRVSALINMQWDDVNFSKGVFIVQEKGSKGLKKTRVVPLSKYTYRLLRWRQQENRPQKSKWVFPSMRLKKKDGTFHKRDLKGKQHIDNPKHIFKKMEERSRVWNAGEVSPLMKKIDRHGLRRTLAKIAEHLGYDMGTLAGLLDHANSGVTATNYLGGTISEERLKECFETCHNYIDNRLRAVIKPQYEEEQKDNKQYSPLLFLLGKPNEELILDKYASVEYQASAFDEETTAFPDMD